ncbi:hypothetical protein VP01_1937g5 [Puccinia sorghi]|uniref:Uncharacterized protein n=1 Tax=Puccinia sorghi TaxID=27349 RepID=A0A0L6VCE1_9BASI|nr:hypothetical protein VP01_1937g5 [Puccinia sorghi]
MEKNSQFTRRQWFFFPKHKFRWKTTGSGCPGNLTCLWCGVFISNGGEILFLKRESGGIKSQVNISITQGIKFRISFRVQEAKGEKGVFIGVVQEAKGEKGVFIGVLQFQLVGINQTHKVYQQVEEDFTLLGRDYHCSLVGYIQKVCRISQ